jgi:putative MATE family efflux protein
MAARDLTQGPVPRLVAVLAVPILVTFGLQTLYALVNLFFVGWLGGPSLAALGIVLNTFFLVLALGQSIGAGGLALISQTYGRGERASLPHVFQQVLWLTTVLGSACWFLGWLLAEPYIRAFTDDPEVIRLGVAFFRVYSATFFTQVTMISLSFSFRGVGDFIVPTALFGGGLLLNLALDPLLIFGLGPVPRLGLLGAAYATVTTQGLVVVGYLWLITVSRHSTLLVLRRPFRVDWRLLPRLLRIGLPSGVQFVLAAGAFMLTYRAIRPFGPDAAAAVTVGFRVMQSATLPAVAIGASVSSLVGQNYGARNLERVKAALGWGLAYMAGIFSFGAALMILFPAFWVSLFTSERGIIVIGADYLFIAAVSLPVYSVGMLTTSVSQGLGRTLAPMLAVGARLGCFALGLFLVEQLLGLSLLRVFWVATLAIALESALMGGVLVYLWRTLLLRLPAVAGAAPVRPAG